MSVRATIAKALRRLEADARVERAAPKTQTRFGKAQAEMQAAQDLKDIRGVAVRLFPAAGGLGIGTAILDQQRKANRKAKP